MTPNQRNATADSEIMEIFRTRNQEPPRIIPVEEAQAVRESVLHPEKKEGKPEDKPITKEAAPVEPLKEKASEPYWQPCGKEAQAQHRWKTFGAEAFTLSLIISAMWMALQTGDATLRLALPVIVICHLVIIVSLIWAWAKR